MKNLKCDYLEAYYYYLLYIFTSSQWHWLLCMMWSRDHVSPFSMIFHWSCTRNHRLSLTAASHGHSHLLSDHEGVCLFFSLYSIRYQSCFPCTWLLWLWLALKCNIWYSNISFFKIMLPSIFLNLYVIKFHDILVNLQTHTQTQIHTHRK